MTKTCPSCGAPIQGFTCKYCGAQFYDFADISFEAPLFIKARPYNSDQAITFKASLSRVELEMSTEEMTLYADAEVMERRVEPKERLHIELKRTR